MSPDEPDADCVSLDDILEEQIRKCGPANTKRPSSALQLASTSRTVLSRLIVPLSVISCSAAAAASRLLSRPGPRDARHSGSSAVSGTQEWSLAIPTEGNTKE